MNKPISSARLTVIATLLVATVAMLSYEQGAIGFLNPLFWSLPNFVGLYLLSILLVLFVVRRQQTRGVVKGVLATLLGIAVAFPLLSPALYAPFEPYAAPRGGYEMLWVTQPLGRVDAALKSAQRRHESAWCHYTLNGWSAENQLYYQSSCVPGYWRFDLASQTRSWSMILPQSVALENTVEQMTVSVGQGIEQAQLPGFASGTAYPVVAYAMTASAETNVQAVAIREYYGPHDIVIIQSK